MDSQFRFCIILGNMGYTDKLQKLCALRGLDQSELAIRVGLSKSSISRILSGAQEPKLRLAYDLAKALGVTLDYLVGDAPESGNSDQLVMVSEDEMMIIKIVRELTPNVAIKRLLNVSALNSPTEVKPPMPQSGGRSIHDSSRGGNLSGGF